MMRSRGAQRTALLQLLLQLLWLSLASSASPTPFEANNVPALAVIHDNVHVDPTRTMGVLQRRRKLQHSNYDTNNSSSEQETSRRHRAYTPAPSPTANSHRWSGYKREHAVNDYYSNLSDVWLCLCMALTWVVWLLSNFTRSDHQKYQRDSVLVRGHVLQVSIQDDSLGTGIPVYTAVIDYMMDTNNTNRNGNSEGNKKNDSQIQIRKHFATQQRLEEGFANVELLVLPEEPTHSVLREDWEKEMEQTITDQDVSLWNRPACKRIAVAVAAILVALSLCAAVDAVTNLEPSFRWQGWLSVCVGVGLLLPVAIFVHRVPLMCQRMIYPSEQNGIVIRGAESTDAGASAWKSPFGCDSLDAGICDDEEQVETASWQGSYVPDTAAGCYSIQFSPRKGQFSPRKQGQPQSPTVDPPVPSLEQQHVAALATATAEDSGSVSTVSSISLRGAASFLNDSN